MGFFWSLTLPLVVGGDANNGKKVLLARTPTWAKILIVNKTGDFLKHLVPVLSRFPKNQRFLLADRIQQTLMTLQELLVEAYYSPAAEKLPKLRTANILIEKMRQYFRICYELGYYNSLKYADLSQRLDEIGNMNGGWIRSLKG